LGAGFAIAVKPDLLRRRCMICNSDFYFCISKARGQVQFLTPFFIPDSIATLISACLHSVLQYEYESDRNCSATLVLKKISVSLLSQF
jgi:hypothetical protein